MKAQLRAYLATLWRFAPRRLVLLAGLTLLSGLTESIGVLLLVPLLVVVGATDGTPSPISEWIESVMASLSIPFSLPWILAVYVVLVTLRALMIYWRTISTARLRLEFVDYMRMRLFRAVAGANWLFHIERKSSDISHTLMADINRVGNGTTLALDAVTRVVVTTAYVLVAFQLSAPITLISIACGVVLGAVLWPQVSRSREVGALQSRAGKRSFGSQAEFLSGMKLAKSHGNEQHHVDAYGEEVGSLRQATLAFQKVSTGTSAAFQIGTVVAVAIIVWIAVEIVEVPAAELLALVAVVSRIAPAASGILGKFQGAANMLPAFESAENLRRAALEAQEAAFGSLEARPVEDAIELRGVSFSYAVGSPALRDVELLIDANTTTALVGPSGAGKTTLADVVLGLIEPDQGGVFVDGVPLAEIGLGPWRKQLAYVPQEPFLFHDSLAANITWGAPETLTDEDVTDLVEAAALTTLVKRLPEGLDTVVGDRGHRLSGGERQRVALARALARKPSLLVLDEATSALDRENELAVQQAIDRLHGELTIVVIAHRLSTIRHADQLAVLDHGRVVETGTWDELVGSGGRLAKLAEATWVEDLSKGQS